MIGVSKHMSCHLSQSQLLLCTYLKLFVTLKSTKIRWSKMYTLIIHKKIWIM